MIRDRDRIYGGIVTRRLRAMGIRDKPTSPASPWQNGFAERLIGSIRRECLDHIVVFGEAHLRRILRSYARYYNDIRTHRSLDKDAPVSRPVQRTGSIKSFPWTPSPLCPGLSFRYTQQWRFGPSKFVGYEGMTSVGYIDTAEDRDGRRTEAQLQLWFKAVDPESELGTQLSSALYGFLAIASNGKAPSTKMRINVPNDVHEKHFGATASDPHDILVATLIAAAKTLPPSHLEKLRASLFAR
jgi:hypothetical protein